jgi:hypothetical protein
MLLALKDPAKLVFPLDLFICHNWMLLEKTPLAFFPTDAPVQTGCEDLPHGPPHAQKQPRSRGQSTRSTAAALNYLDGGRLGAPFHPFVNGRRSRDS